MAEREWPMRVRWGRWRVLSLVAGVVQIPGVTDVLEKFLEPTFEDSRFHDDAPSAAPSGSGLAAGGVISIVGSARLRRRTCAGAASRSQLRDRFAARARASSCNKWYFDELYDACSCGRWPR